MVVSGSESGEKKKTTTQASQSVLWIYLVNQTFTGSTGRPAWSTFSEYSFKVEHRFRMADVEEHGNKSLLLIPLLICLPVHLSIPENVLEESSPSRSPM